MTVYMYKFRETAASGEVDRNIYFVPGTTDAVY